MTGFNKSKEDDSQNDSWKNMTLFQKVKNGALIIVVVLGGLIAIDKIKDLVRSNSGTQPSAHQEFDKRVIALKKSLHEVEPESRDEKRLWDERNKFWASIKNMKVENWNCIYTGSPWKKQNNIIDDDYWVPCYDADPNYGAVKVKNIFAIGGSEDLTGPNNFILFIPIQNLQTTNEFYKGDKITFSGTVRYAEDNKIEFVNVENVSVTIGKK